ncbi:SpoIIIAH-like family protein [Bacillus marinisedimentorum]|uniref:SpoIIIAH-like family protein n=1 Tax=Bacillus marinisedimentorum TaxID=1821260 RepID=UPI0008734A7C|nr:SpoIIIAH-like family protein [Bacillus marinisedimentorum]
MILKKQTVWLLTMLSLVVVLSVYYITSPEQEDPFAMDDEKAEEQAAKEAEADAGAVDDVTVKEADKAPAESAEGVDISGISTDEAFTALRLEMETQRSRVIEDLEAIVASADQPVEKKNEAYEEMQEIRAMASKESILETMIRTKGYEDALVNAEGDQVRVIVKAKEHSKTAAVDIMKLVEEEFGGKLVAVEFQPVN